MKKVVLFIFIINSFSNAQVSDDQWYIWNNKYGSNASADHNTLLSSNKIQIHNVQHPASDFILNGINRDTKNDLFIIFNNGDYFNSRSINTNCFTICDATMWDYKLNLTNPLPSGGTPTSDQIKYLYYSNIYEDDDPSSDVSILQPPSTSTTLYELTATSYNQNSNTLSSNHDVVKGADYTLIIPKLWDLCSKISIKYEKDLFIFDQLLNPVVGASINPYSSPGNLILNDPFVGNNFNFVNFHTPSNSTYSLESCKIDVGCLSNPNNIMQDIKSIYEVIGTSHDPNYIKVKCIEKKVNGTKTKYFVRYLVAFENDGLSPAKRCSLKFSLPNTVLANSLKIKNWYYGNKNGCTYQLGKFEKLSSSLPKYLFVFNKMLNDSIILKGIVSPLKFRQAYIEFCVQVNPIYNNFISNCNLQPTNCYTYFDDVPYTIDRFIDRDFNNKIWPDSTIHRKPVINCCQNCALTNNIGVN